ncbi:hypothetical protein SLEP1_g47303 [Rubroshorea leprosula]|uniref:Uncharacterized protein n=1 Tax=Rubroshorea leprosula TaxID=152421 RepID=A0AAV5LQ04_9ROSI|nr:hypothetical protein SLEP1_g47303 [Rubroshorea leprosula]
MLDYEAAQTATKVGSENPNSKISSRLKKQSPDSSKQRSSTKKPITGSKISIWPVECKKKLLLEIFGEKKGRDLEEKGEAPVEFTLKLHFLSFAATCAASCGCTYCYFVASFAFYYNLISSTFAA